MAEDKKECKVVDILTWAKDKEIQAKKKKRARILSLIINRGNPLDKNISGDS